MTIAAECGLRIEILRDLAAAEPLWRSFQDTAIATPFQRFDWVAAYAATAGARDEIRVAALRDGADRLQVLMPFAIANRFGCRVASGIGGKHASFTMPLIAPGFHAMMAARDAGPLMTGIGRALGADAFMLANVPTVWAGEPNPLAPGGVDTAAAFRLDLAATGDDTLARCMSRDGRKKLRSKERALAQLGPVAFVRANGETGIDLILDAFFRQKRERFRELGIRDPFLDDGVRAFLRRAALPPAPGAAPAIALFALTLGGTPLAVFGGAIDSAHLSGMFISFDAGHEASRLSPGDILVSRIIGACCEAGLRSFDLGIGDARYKRTFCDGEIALADLIMPLTRRGRAYAAASASGIALKRRLKTSAAAMRLLAALRRAKPGAGPRAAAG